MRWQTQCMESNRHPFGILICGIFGEVACDSETSGSKFIIHFPPAPFRRLDSSGRPAPPRGPADRLPGKQRLGPDSQRHPGSGVSACHARARRHRNPDCAPHACTNAVTDRPAGIHGQRLQGGCLERAGKRELLLGTADPAGPRGKSARARSAGCLGADRRRRAALEEGSARVPGLGAVGGSRGGLAGGPGDRGGGEIPQPDHPGCGWRGPTAPACSTRRSQI